MSKKAWVLSGFFAVLIVVFYFSVRHVIKPNDTIAVVQSFAFTNQDGKQFTNTDVDGKVYVAEFFFTTCRGICPHMQGNMKKVYEAFKDEKDFLIVSHTSDPDNDSVPRLRKYADSMGVNTHRWVFLTGRKDSLYNMARVSYAIDNPENNVTLLTDPFIHTQFWALVDRHGDVKHIYDGLKASEADAMIGKIRKMLKEE
jgi:protein SCO1/2